MSGVTTATSASAMLDVHRRCDGPASSSLWLLFVCLGLLVARHVAAQPPVPANKCAACHLQLVWTVSQTTHVDEWVTSKHAAYRVGCERCHGGDVVTSDANAAHRGVVGSADRSSAVHRMALPRTCGGCHPAAANAFIQSIHHELLKQGNLRAPTCTTCHSSMATEVLAPAALEKRCRQCHATDPSDRAAVARRQTEDLTRLQRTLTRAKLEIAGILDRTRREALRTQWNDADIALRAVASGFHAFDEQRVENRLSDARIQTERLAAALRRRPAR
jgi:cytochrome c554/c'-like protein